jgi:hypothetical protein
MRSLAIINLQGAPHQTTNHKEIVMITGQHEKICRLLSLAAATLTSGKRDAASQSAIRGHWEKQDERHISSLAQYGASVPHLHGRCKERRIATKSIADMKSPDSQSQSKGARATKLRRMRTENLFHHV